MTQLSTIDDDGGFATDASACERLAGWLGPLVPRGLRPIAAATVARALVRTVPVAASGVTVLDSAALQAAGALP
jgi:hypothetical protein